MKAIRGATTVNSDTADEIKSSVKELLGEINEQNGLKAEEIICILFSNTEDIRSFYPAKAAREAGYFSAPLYSSLEPDIEGSLKNCIRVLVFADIDRPPKHIYLKGAKILRKDIANVINIAIDGPAGSGKSTISHIIAKKLDILCLDTGAMYRACALACVYKKVDAENENAVEKLLEHIDLSVKYLEGEQRTLLGGKDVSDKIRTPEISMLASKVSALKCVREKMVDLQREIAKNTSCILDGRDIGTNVLPDAKFKFYLDASPEIRAKRRYAENIQKGYEASYEKVLADVILRDKQDVMRKIAPLKRADDAVFIDTTDMTVEEVVNFILNKIQEKI